jgi:hypothetical protein
MSEPALMTEAAPAPSLVLPSASPMRWRIAVLVSAAIAISYLDRQTLPWAITAIQRDIPISNQVKAFLDSAFLVTYGLMYPGRRTIRGLSRNATRFSGHHDFLVARVCQSWARR